MDFVAGCLQARYLLNGGIYAKLTQQLEFLFDVFFHLKTSVFLNGLVYTLCGHFNPVSYFCQG